MANDFEFRRFMLQLGQRMSSNDFGQLKYLLKGYVSNAKCEEIKSVFEYFEELERMCLLTPTNFGVLKKALGVIGRQDLVEEMEQKKTYFANLFKDRKGDALEPKEYDAVCDGITEAAGDLKPFPRSGQNTLELQEKMKLTSLENEDKVQLDKIADTLGMEISDMLTAVTDLRKENKETKKENDLPLKKEEWPMQSQHLVEMRTGGDEEEEVKPTPHMDNAESMEVHVPHEDTAQSNSTDGAEEAEDHQLEPKTTKHALACGEKMTLSTTNGKEPVEDTVSDCNELMDLNTGPKAKLEHSIIEAATGTTSSPQLGDDVVTDGEEHGKGIMADSKKDEIKTTSDKAKHPGAQHPHGPGARPKEPLSKKAKTVDPSGADKQIATEQADEVAETNLHGTLFAESVHPEKTSSKEPTEDVHSGPWDFPTGEVSSGDGNESDELYSSHDNESTPMHETSMHGQGKGANATASKAGCYHPPGFFSTPPNQNASGYSGHASAGNYYFPESTMYGLGQGASAAASNEPLGCHYPPGASKPTGQKSFGCSDQGIPNNFSLIELTQIASALGWNFESSELQQPEHQMELLKKLLALQTSVSDAQGSSSHCASTADSALMSNCYSKDGYSVVITNGLLSESTHEKGVVVMESGTQFCILIANNNNYAAEVDITFGGMWLGVWVVEAKQSLSTPLVIEGSSWAEGRLKFFSDSDMTKPQPSVDIYGEKPTLNGRIELEFKPEVKMLIVHAKHVREDKLFEISIIESKTTTVGDLKQEIRKKWNSDISYLLKGGEVLQEEKTISSYALNENEVIGVLNAEEELKIESSGRNPVVMMVDPRNVSVQAVKDFIAKEIKIPVLEQVLRFTEEDTDVDSESLTQLLLTSEKAPVLKVDKDRTINVIVVLPNRGGEKEKVEIKWSATVENLKEELQERDICDSSCVLRFDDKEISGQDNKKLIHLGFKTNSEITVLPKTRSTTRGFSGFSNFDGFRGSNLRGFGGFGGSDDYISSPSGLRGLPKGTRAFRNGPEDDSSLHCSSLHRGEKGVALLHGTEESVFKNFEIDQSQTKFSKEKAVTIIIELKAKSMGAAGGAAGGGAAASSQTSVPPGAYYSGGPTGPMSTPTPPPVPD